MKEKKDMGFKQNLTYKEQEWLAYISGDTKQADILGTLDDYNQDGFDLDETLNELGIYGERGKLLYDKVLEFKKELEVYKEVFEAVKGKQSLPYEVKVLIGEVKDKLDL